MKIYRITFIIWFFQIFALTLPQAQNTVIQKDWYRGPGTLVRNYTWANDYFRAESLNTLNHDIVFKASEINTTSWDTMILLSSEAIESHTHYHYADLDDDGDSVSVILDSLYDSRGCRSIFKR